MRELVDEARAWLAWAQDSGLRILTPEARKGTPAAEPGAQQTVGTEVPVKLPLLEGVRAEIGECTRCKLHKTRTNIVFGIGSPSERLMFVGGERGEDEEVWGFP